MTKPDIVMGNSLSKIFPHYLLKKKSITRSVTSSFNWISPLVSTLSTRNRSYFTHNLNLNLGSWTISFDKISDLANLWQSLNYSTNLAFWGTIHPGPSLPTMTVSTAQCVPRSFAKKSWWTPLGISSCSWDIIFPILWFYLISAFTNDSQFLNSPLKNLVRNL